MMVFGGQRDRPGTQSVDRHVDVGHRGRAHGGALHQEAPQVLGAEKDVDQLNTGDRFLRHDLRRLFRPDDDVHARLAGGPGPPVPTLIAAGADETDEPVEVLQRHGEHTAREAPSGRQLAEPMDQEGFDAFLMHLNTKAFELLLAGSLGIDMAPTGGTVVVTSSFVHILHQLNQAVAVEKERWEVAIGWIGAPDKQRPPEFDKSEVGKPVGCRDDLWLRLEEARAMP